MSKEKSMRNGGITIAVCVSLVLAMGGVALAEQLFPFRVGDRAYFTRTDNSGNAWTCWLEITAHVTLDSNNYFGLRMSNYGNDGVMGTEHFRRWTENELYHYNPDGPDYLGFQVAPLGTKWTVYRPDPDEEYDWEVHEIVDANGNVTVPYGTFSGSYTVRTYETDDPNDPNADRSPHWDSTIVPGVAYVKEVDYWTDDPPTTMELVSMIRIGDVNGDGNMDNLDISPFVATLTNDDANFHVLFPDGDYWAADVNGDGNVDNIDISAFVALLTGGQAIPEPATLSMLALGGFALLRRRNR